MSFQLLLVFCRDWNNPLDQKNSQKEQLPTEGLVVWYPFNGNSRDESGSGYDGTVIGPALTVDRFGANNKAYLFDGKDDLIDTNHDFSWSLGDSFSISLWFKIGSTLQKHVLIGKDGTQNWEFALGLDSQRLFFVYWRLDANGELTMSTELPGLPYAAWYHVGIVYNGQIRIGHMYVNGASKSSDANVTSTFQNRTNTMRIGFGYFNSGTAYGFNGSIDDVRIYNRALADKEILALYHEGGYVPPLAVPKIAATGLSDSSIQVTWNTIENSNLYLLEMSAAITGPFTALYTGSDTLAIHRGLTRSQRVWYRVRAQNTMHASAWSDTISAVAVGIPADGMIIYYPFTGHANDYSGHNHHGTVTGATLTNDRFGRDLNAYAFDGNADVINTNFVLPNIFSLSIWFSKDANQNNNAGVL